MIGEEEYEASSGDVGIDFARLETKFRNVLRDNLNTADNNNYANTCYIEYINHVLAVADEFGLDLFEGITVPYRSDKNCGDVADRVQTIADNFKARVNLAKAQGRSRFSVTLSSQEKAKIRHWAELIKLEIEKSAIEKDIKIDLLDSLNIFLKKLDREKTRLQDFTDFVLNVSATAGIAADNIEPWWKWIGSIATVLGLNMQAHHPRLTKPQVQLRLEDKKSRFSNDPQEVEEEPF